MKMIAKLQFLITFIIISIVVSTSFASNSLSNEQSIKDCDVYVVELNRDVEKYILPLTYVSDEDISQLPEQINTLDLSKLIEQNDKLTKCGAKSYFVDEEHITLKYNYPDIATELNSLIGILQSIADDKNPDEHMLILLSKYIKKYYSQLKEASRKN